MRISSHVEENIFFHMTTDVIALCPLTQVSSLKKPVDDTHLKEFNLERIRMGRNGRILSAFETQTF